MGRILIDFKIFKYHFPTNFREEIRVRLTLPEAIVLSTSIQELQVSIYMSHSATLLYHLFKALDLMGQGYS